MHQPCFNSAMTAYCHRFWLVYSFKLVYFFFHTSNTNTLSKIQNVPPPVKYPIPNADDAKYANVYGVTQIFQQLLPYQAKTVQWLQSIGYVHLVNVVCPYYGPFSLCDPSLWSLWFLWFFVVHICGPYMIHFGPYIVNLNI